MKSLPEARGVAKKDNTAKRGKSQQKAKRFILGFTIILILCCATYYYSQQKSEKTPAQATQTISRQQAKIPLASEPVAEWAKLILPPNGKSERIPVPPGMEFRVSGRGADLHTVYSDGHESVISVESGESNPSGPIVGEYVTNRTNETNIVSYAFK